MKQLGSAFRSSANHARPLRSPNRQTKKVDNACRTVPQLADWLCGFGLALAELNRHYENVTAVNEVMRDAGVTPDMLHTAGLDDYDLNEIKKCWKQRPKSWRRRA